jgi:hypothetical protein
MESGIVSAVTVGLVVRWAPLASAIAGGVAMAIWGLIGPEQRELLTAVLQGAGLGLAGSGLYAVAGKIGSQA